MSRVVAEVLFGLFTSWEFLFITGAITVLLPFVFSLASRKAPVKKTERPPVLEGGDDAPSED